MSHYINVFGLASNDAEIKEDSGIKLIGVCAEEISNDFYDGFEIDVNKIPKSVKKIVFYSGT